MSVAVRSDGRIGGRLLGVDGECRLTAMTDASAPGAPLDRATRVSASSEAVSAALEGETVILGMHDGVYYGLDAVGSRIWTLMQQPVALGAVHEVIVAEYAVAAEVAWQDLVTLVADLLGAGLLVRHGAD
jgi:hypothetical protein